MTLLVITALLVAYLAYLQYEDVVWTNKALASGKGAELDPITRWFQTKFGSYWWISKLIIVPGAIFALLSPMLSSVIALAIVNGFYLWVVSNNEHIVNG